MGDTSRGILSATDIILLSDALATVFKGSYANFQSLTTATQALRGKVLGDGTQTGLANASVRSSLQIPISAKVSSSKYDKNFQRTDTGIVSVMNSNVSGNLPPGWSFNGLMPLDAHLTRLNATSSSAPATPGSAGTLTGATTSGGGLVTTTSGNACYVVHSYVGTKDYYESQPSAQATRVALTGPQNSYTYAIAGNVPTGVTKVRIYRSLQPGTSSQWYWDQDIAVVAGVAFSTYTMTIKQPDSMLRVDTNPPSYASCMMTPEFATIFAESTATLPITQGIDTLPLSYNSATMLSPCNVMIGNSQNWMGDGNPSQSVIYGSRDLSTTFVNGSIQTANVSASNIQGFAGCLAKGAQSMQVRSTTNLNGSAHFTFDITYYNAANPQSGSAVVDSAVATAADFVGSIAGETMYISETAGRVIVSLAQAGKTGTSTTGVVLVEGNVGRTY